MITTPRLILKLHNRQTETLKHEVSWLNDKEVTKYSEQRHRTHTIDTQINFLDSLPPYDAFYQVWLGERHIGGVTACYDPHNGVIDLGIMIGDRTVWGQGYGREAWEGVMEECFKKNRNLRKIEAGCMAGNAAMILICMRSGMVKEASIPHHFYFNHRPMDMVKFGKIRT